jgi:hypothetical protein
MAREDFAGRSGTNDNAPLGNPTKKRRLDLPPKYG